MARQTIHDFLLKNAPAENEALIQIEKARKNGIINLIPKLKPQSVKRREEKRKWWQKNKHKYNNNIDKEERNLATLNARHKTAFSFGDKVIKHADYDELKREVKKMGYEVKKTKSPKEFLKMKYWKWRKNEKKNCRSEWILDYLHLIK
jgi:hypothetical protein